MKKFIILIIGVVIFCMAILGILAKNSQPGERLYGYRLSVREPVIGTFYVTAERHGDYELGLLEVRLTDMLSLIHAGSPEDLVATALDSFRARETKVVGRITHLARSGKIEIADNLNATFRAYITAYGAMLKVFPEPRTGAQEILQEALLDAASIDEQLTNAFSSRYKVQDLIKKFDDRLREAQSLLTEIEGQLSGRGQQLDPDYRKALEQRLDYARNVLTSARAKHGNDLDREAYREVNRAVALLTELQIYLASVNIYPTPKLEL